MVAVQLPGLPVPDGETVGLTVGGTDSLREIDVHVGVLVGVRVNVCVGILLSVGVQDVVGGLGLRGTVCVCLSSVVGLTVALRGLLVRESVGVIPMVLVEIVRECPVHMKLRLGLHVCVGVNRFVTV